jgi:hypothetical protein
MVTTYDPGSLPQVPPPTIEPPFAGAINDFGDCYMDGVRSPCGIVMSMMERGWAVEAPWDNTATVWNPISGQYELWRFTVDWDNGFFGFVPIGANYGGDGTWSWRGGGRDDDEADGRLSQGHIPKIDRLENIGREFGERVYDRFYNILYDFVNDKDCVAAFKDVVDIDLVKLLADRGIRIGPSDYFTYSGINFKERLGLTDEGLKNARAATGTTIRAAYTIGRPEFLVERSLPTILIRGNMVAAGIGTIAETLAHELVHAGGRRGRRLTESEQRRASLLGGPNSPPHDLDDIPGFSDLIDKCAGRFR